MSRRLDLLARIGVLCLLWAGLLFAGRQLRQEWRVKQVEAGKPVGAILQDPFKYRDIAYIPPRAALLGARQMAQAATLQSDPIRRQALLTEGRTWIGYAIRARPRWGEASVIDAYLLLLQYGASDGRTLEAFSRSLRDAPYLKTAADWRILYGAQLWSELDNATRIRVLNEALWLSRNARSDAKRVKRLLGNGDAARAFAKY